MTEESVSPAPESIGKLAEEDHGLLENIFNTIAEGVMVIGHNLKIKYRNPAATRLLGIPDDTSDRKSVV